MTEQDPQRSWMDEEDADEDETHELSRQTPGLDPAEASETSGIAGPDWDADLVEDARTSLPGEPLEGEVED